MKVSWPWSEPSVDFPRGRLRALSLHASALTPFVVVGCHSRGRSVWDRVVYTISRWPMRREANCDVPPCSLAKQRRMNEFPQFSTRDAIGVPPAQEDPEGRGKRPDERRTRRDRERQLFEFDLHVFASFL
jgi:hypothetical protein